VLPGVEVLLADSAHLVRSRRVGLLTNHTGVDRCGRRTVDLLHGWDRSAWNRPVNDPRGGDMSLLEVCRVVARHEMGHIAQIRNLSALLPEPQDLGPVRPPASNGK
jgi:hypothetical protein